jgi:ABC-2 type transport system ATP-binding protein
VALSLTLAKRPRLLLLDEPVAALDPLARRNFLATLTSAVADAEGGLTVVLSSHLVTDLERVCDHLVLLAGSRSSSAVTSSRCWRSTRSWSGRTTMPR